MLRRGSLKHRFWGRRASSTRLGLRRNIASRFAQHHHRLSLGEHYFWGRCTIITSISRQISASYGAALAFRQHLFCSRATRLLCARGRQNPGRLLHTWYSSLLLRQSSDRWNITQSWYAVDNCSQIYDLPLFKMNLFSCSFTYTRCPLCFRSKV